MHIGPCYNGHFRIKGLRRFSNFELLIVISLLLLNSGDIEFNPGPLSERSTTCMSVSIDISIDESIIRNSFSLVHYNVQILAKQTNILLSELFNFDIISITETWLNYRTSDDGILLQGHNTIRRDRDGDNHEGVYVYVKNNISSKRRNNLELPHIECVGLKSLY